MTALVAGKVFAKFHLDVGFGDPSFDLPDELVGQDFLAFAGIPPARVLAIPKAQQFAEKLHAYTFPWNDRPNTRVKDLVDLVLLATRDPPNREVVKEAVRITFDVRKSHALPSALDPPPAEWAATFASMAREVDLTSPDLMEGFQILQSYWTLVSTSSTRI